MKQKESDASSSAVVWYDKNEKKQTLTYRGLYNEVKRRAFYFVNTLQFQKGEVVAVLAPRGPEYLINMLALWEIGAVYLPLSDAWKDLYAISNRLKKSGAVCLLTLDKTHRQFSVEINRWLDDGDNEYRKRQIGLIDAIESQSISTSENRADQFFNVECSPNSPAYIFSSSGTTGEPKFIQLPHAGIWDRIDDHIEYMSIRSGDGVLGFIDFGFDASVVEMLIAFRTGNTFLSHRKRYVTKATNNYLNLLKSTHLILKLAFYYPRC